MLWRLLDEPFGESRAELFERAERKLNTYWMRRLRAQYTRVGPDSVISDRDWAQRLLNRASLSERAAGRVLLGGRLLHG